MPTFPIDFNDIRKALVAMVTAATGLTCILEEQKGEKGEAQTRPDLPYASLKITTPATRFGDDTTQPVSDTVINRGGQRRMSVSFHVYDVDQEDAYNAMALLQSKLDQFGTQELLRKSGIAVWIIGNVADLSALLNTGYEGRSQMDCQFGIAANLTEDVGQIKKVGITGTAHTDGSDATTSFEVDS